MKQLLFILLFGLLVSCNGKSGEVAVNNAAVEEVAALDKSFYDFNTELQLQKERYRPYIPITLSKEYTSLKVRS